MRVWQQHPATSEHPAGAAVAVAMFTYKHVSMPDDCCCTRLFRRHFSRF